MGKSSLKAVEATLHSLRDGELSLDAALARARPILHARARWFCEESWLGKAQTLLGADDLVTEMCLELGRAVDRWDVGRCASLAHYCDVQVGRWAQRMLREAAGWPDSRRPTKANVLYIEDLRAKRGEHGEFRDFTGGVEGVSGSMELLMHQLMNEGGVSTRVETVEEFLARAQGEGPRLALLKEKVGVESFEGLLMLKVLEGASIAEAAKAIYANPRLRLRFRLDSEAHAERVGYNAAYSVRRVAEALPA